MEPRKKLGNIKSSPIWLIALIPLLGIVWGAWYIAKHVI
ncbi:hypothetical protein HY29_16295 [Hyphomonas beringensis]|uniref:Uncharacterized protein n=2 Tax=Hyphomonas TaxID=85 RepID=A0A062U2F3_9PROT|nr:hypothetical protein HY2_14345 [Hyphomonas pacifica]KCZ53696.1 hypothetical protein HY29_16295 [Hyphomonas beringensis]RAN32598.1 hypothetical protein HY3_14825 [Hyphomonas pacifica]RAN36277.1 hypothetical protein HY11_11965 [Hyphomonas pacifica]|tara:strand:+ start:154 stop:270 length:117 start_codon:yes stop_codon:yes gene_type:complete